MPNLSICFKPQYKRSVLGQYNATIRIFLYQETNISIKVNDLYEKAVYKLNQDFDIHFLSNPFTNERILLKKGVNQIKWNNEYQKLIVEEMRSLRKGLCYALIFPNIHLKLEDSVQIAIEDKSDSNRDILDFERKKRSNGLKIVDLGLSFGNQYYLHPLWLLLPGIKAYTISKKIKSKSDSVEIVRLSFDEWLTKFAKDCNDTNESLYQNFGQEIIEHQNEINCSNICIPIGLQEFFDLSNTSNLTKCQSNQEHYCMIQNVKTIQQITTQ